VQYIHHLKENEARNIEKWTLEKLLMDQVCFRADNPALCMVSMSYLRGWPDVNEQKKIHFLHLTAFISSLLISPAPGHGRPPSTT
jgi:hypothetical protein